MSKLLRKSTGFVGDQYSHRQLFARVWAARRPVSLMHGLVSETLKLLLGPGNRHPVGRASKTILFGVFWPVTLGPGVSVSSLPEAQS